MLSFKYLNEISKLIGCEEKRTNNPALIKDIIKLSDRIEWTSEDTWVGDYNSERIKRMCQKLGLLTGDSDSAEAVLRRMYDKWELIWMKDTTYKILEYFLLITK